MIFTARGFHYKYFRTNTNSYFLTYTAWKSCCSPFSLRNWTGIAWGKRNLQEGLIDSDFKRIKKLTGYTVNPQLTTLLEKVGAHHFRMILLLSCAVRLLQAVKINKRYSWSWHTMRNYILHIRHLPTMESSNGYIVVTEIWTTMKHFGGEMQTILEAEWRC